MENTNLTGKARGAMVGAEKAESEMKSFCDRMDSGNQDLESIRRRLQSISERVFGPKPANLADPKSKTAEVVPSNFSHRIRSALDYNQKMQQDVYELLTEIENFL